ncbi:hypothetical protein BAE40_13415 [Mesorhizobium loti]|nr:hypothetical protein BAE40_13415 [Mesorhizobium loti]
MIQTPESPFISSKSSQQEPMNPDYLGGLTYLPFLAEHPLQVLIHPRLPFIWHAFQSAQLPANGGQLVRPFNAEQIPLRGGLRRRAGIFADRRSMPG